MSRTWLFWTGRAGEEVWRERLERYCQAMAGWHVVYRLAEIAIDDRRRVAPVSA